MDKDAHLRILVEIICSGDLGSQKIFERYSTVTSSFGKNFSVILKIVMGRKKFIVTQRWLPFLNTCYRKMFDSHEMYLTFIMFACVSEYKSHINIFESFISVCSVVNFLINQTFAWTTVNFSELELDIVMAIYQKKMKNTFCRSGGSKRLIDYIRGHPFAKEYSNEGDLKSDRMNDLNSEDESDLNNEEFEKELFEVEKISINVDEIKIDETSINLARNVLSTTKAKLPPLPSENDLIGRLVAYRRHLNIMRAEMMRKIDPSGKFHLVSFTGSTDSASDSKTKHGEIKEDNNESYEKVIQAVIKHNHSKASSEKKANNPKQEEADRILHHLKETIESLVKVLDKHDKE